jgi:hypothetical protein
MISQERKNLLDGLVIQCLLKCNFIEARAAASIAGREVRPQELKEAALSFFNRGEFQTVLTFMRHGMYQQDKNFFFAEMLKAEEFLLALHAIRDKLVNTKRKDIDLIVFQFIKLGRLKDAFLAARYGATKKCLKLLLNRLIEATCVVDSLKVAELLKKELSFKTRKKLLGNFFQENTECCSGFTSVLLVANTLKLDSSFAYDLIIEYFIVNKKTAVLEDMVYNSGHPYLRACPLVVYYFEGIERLDVLVELGLLHSVKRIALSCLERGSVSNLCDLPPNIISNLDFSESEQTSILEVCISKESYYSALQMFDSGFTIQLIDELTGISPDISTALKFAEFGCRSLTNDELESFL